jgi:hypothetical protein
MRFDILTTVKKSVVVFWVVMPCRNIGDYLQDCTASQPRRSQCASHILTYVRVSLCINNIS